MPEEIPAVADPAPEEIVAPVSAPVEPAVADPAPVEAVVPTEEIDVDQDEMVPQGPPPTISAFRDLQSRLIALEAHFLQVVGHLAQSFGDVYKAKHDALKGA